MSKNRGALPDSLLYEMVETGFIKGAKKEHVGPASLDLCISEEVYRVNGMFQPRPGEKIKDLMSRLDAVPHHLGTPFEHEVTYLARLQESLELPRHVYGHCNPKSSTGRHDVHVRVIADGVSRYDAVAPAGFSGELWMVIVARSYPVIIPEGEPLSQLRLFNMDTRISEEELEIAFRRDGILFTPEGEPIAYKNIPVHENNGSVLLTLDLQSEIIGYEYSGRQCILDFGKGKQAYNAEDFFNPMRVEKGLIFLRRGGFYILSTAESVCVPPTLACEMVPMEAQNGEFRAHYAGFIDPGWGYGKDGEGKGRSLTLEVRPFEDLIVVAGQPIAKIGFERMSRVPDLHYDGKAEGNYHEQRGPKLSKHFK